MRNYSYMKKGVRTAIETREDQRGRIRILEFDDRAIQSSRENADIREILIRFSKGIIPKRTVERPISGDIIDSQIDYSDAKNIIIKANQEFDRLPSKIRDFFDNDPSIMMNFLRDEKNMKKAEELGLLKKEEKEEEFEVSLSKSSIEAIAANKNPESAS